MTLKGLLMLRTPPMWLIQDSFAKIGPKFFHKRHKRTISSDYKRSMVAIVSNIDTVTIAISLEIE